MRLYGIVKGAIVGKSGAEVMDAPKTKDGRCATFMQCQDKRHLAYQAPPGAVELCQGCRPLRPPSEGS